MNKKLIALAVAGATVAPAAMAQTANPVTLYGRVHLTFEQVESKGSPGVAKRTRVQDQASFLGVRGTEDLGGGLKAFFQLETGFAPDAFPTIASGITAPAGTGFANRNSGVGLQGGWGSIMMGRWDTPFKQVAGSIDPFGDVTIAGLTVAMSDQGNFDRRDGNMLQYWSPSWGGFSFKAMWQTSESKTSSANPYDQSYSVAWARGPFYVFAAWEEHKDQAGGSATGTPPFPAGTGQVESGRNEEGIAIGGSWVIGPVKIGGQYQEFEKSANLLRWNDRKSWMGNVVWTLGNHQLIYQYQQSEGGGLSTLATQPECDVNSIAWQYNFSRRTFTQLIYNKIDNNSTANCGAAPFSAAVVPAGTDPQGISLGLRHIF